MPLLVIGPANYHILIFYLKSKSTTVGFSPHHCNTNDANLHNFHIQIQFKDPHFCSERFWKHPDSFQDCVSLSVSYCLSAPCHIKADGLLLITSCGTIESILSSAGGIMIGKRQDATASFLTKTGTSMGGISGVHPENSLFFSSPQTQNIKGKQPKTLYVYLWEELANC